MVKAFYRDEQGVSVIVGALLLVLITIVAAAGLAIIVSEAEQRQMERQEHIAAVENEELKIVSIALSGSTTWETINLTVLNLNTASSKIIAVRVNDYYATNFTSEGVQYNITKKLPVPATKDVTININLSSNFSSPLLIFPNQTITVEVTTGYINYFSKTMKPPVSLSKMRIESQNIGIAIRDFLVLDGSDSFDDGAVTGWEWQVYDGHKTFGYPGNWTDAVNVTGKTYYGKLVNVYPDSQGPFLLRLIVTDDMKMKSDPCELIIPANSNFDPPVYILVNKNNSTINATVLDINRLPVEGLPVNFIIEHDLNGNLTLSSWSGVTDAYGNATTSVLTGNGTIVIYAGRMTPVKVTV